MFALKFAHFSALLSPVYVSFLQSNDRSQSILSNQLLTESTSQSLNKLICLLFFKLFQQLFKVFYAIVLCVNLKTAVSIKHREFSCQKAIERPVNLKPSNPKTAGAILAEILL